MVVHQLQVSQDILNLLPFIKLHPSNDRIRNLAFNQFVFYGTGLGINPVKDSHITIGPDRLLRGDSLYDFLYDKTRLIHFILGHIKGEEFAFRILCPEFLLLSVPIFSYDMAGCLENVLRGAIILFQGENFSLRKVLLKIQNISYLCASPAVDGLVIVSDHTDILMGLDHLSDELILNQVGILKLINHHITAEFLISFEDLRMAPEKNRHKGEKISKVEGVVSSEILLVALINHCQSLLENIIGIRRILVRCDPLIFQSING